MCGRTPSAPSSSPASAGPSQHSVPFSASGGHQSLHIARWLLLETKEEDFGCQFLSTSFKVCVEAEEAIYPNQGAHCSGCCDTAGWGLISGPRPEVMRSQILVPEPDSACESSLWGLVAGGRDPCSKALQDRRLPSPLLHMPGSRIHQRNKRCQRHKASEADRGK